MKILYFYSYFIKKHMHFNYILPPPAFIKLKNELYIFKNINEDIFFTLKPIVNLRKIFR